jgi:hypothetical protein
MTLRFFHVVDGIYPNPDNPEEYILHLLGAEDGEEESIDEYEYFFNSFDDAYSVVRYFQRNVIPIDEEGLIKVIEGSKAKKSYEDRTKEGVKIKYDS